MMTKRTCLGCGVELTGEVITFEHALPQWLAKEIELPGVSLKHYLHDEGSEDKLLRSHGLNTFGAKSVCGSCNNGWMSRLEDAAKPHIVSLMHEKASILTVTDDARTILSRWAVKTAFIISVVQTLRFELPWEIFQNLRKHETGGPNGCFVLASQQRQLPKGYLSTFPSDELKGNLVQLRVGFSINHLHFVVVIPLVQGLRMVRVAAGVHVPFWPLDMNVLAAYKMAPTDIGTPNKFLDFLTNLVEAGIVTRKDAVREVEGENTAVA